MPIESFVATASHFPVSHLIEPFFWWLEQSWHLFSLLQHATGFDIYIYIYIYIYQGFLVTRLIVLVYCCGVNEMRYQSFLCQVSWLAHGLPCQCGRNHSELESLGKSWLSMPSNGCVSTNLGLQSPKPELVLLSVTPRNYKNSKYFGQFGRVCQPVCWGVSAN